MAKMRLATNESYSDGQPIPSLSHDPRTLPLHAAQLQQRLLSGDSEAGIRRLGRTDVDLPVRTFIKMYMSFKLNTYISRRPVLGVEPGTGGFTMLSQYTLFRGERS